MFMSIHTIRHTIRHVPATTRTGPAQQIKACVQTASVNFRQLTEAVIMDGSFSDKELALIALFLDESESEIKKANKRKRQWIHSILKKKEKLKENIGHCSNIY